MTDAERATNRELMNSAADRLSENFDSVVILASVVSEGVTLWFCSPRGNRYASADMARRFAVGEFCKTDPDEFIET